MKKIRLHLSKASLKDDDLVCKLQGFLIEKLSDDFASFLHQQETNPYSMNLRSEREESIWTVNLLSEEAEQQILPQLLSLETIKLETYSEEILVKNIEIQFLSSQSLLEIFQGDEASHLISLNFYTPTTFKRQGQFVLFPDTRLIFQSLMQKYSRLVEGKAEIEEETLEFLAEHSKITS